MLYVNEFIVSMSVLSNLRSTNSEQPLDKSKATNKTLSIHKKLFYTKYKMLKINVCVNQ